VKIFKSTDEPNAPNISQEEYMKIQEEVRKNPHKFKIEEIRKKEVTMDISQQKEPEITWKFPKKIKLDQEIENEFNEHGKESQQNKYIEDICESELKVYYFNEIPEPIEKEKKMYSFTDENIPKIENSQKATKTNDVTIKDISNFWENIGNNITKENLRQLEELLGKAIDIDNESKKQVLEQAQKKLEQQEMINNQLNENNNININNNLTINNNQRILSMSNYPSLMNFNNINQISGAALSLLNNPSMKPIQPNIDQISYLSQVQTQNNITAQNANNFNKPIQQQPNQNISNNIPNAMPNIPLNNIQNINYGIDPNLNVINQLNNYQQQFQNNANNMNRNKSNLDQRMILESAQRMNISKYKTKPCRNYHSSTGCTRGDNCFFIHDPNFKGREIQNFDLRNYERNFPLQIPAMLPGAMGLAQMPNLTPQIGNQIYQMQQMGMNPMNLGLNLQQMQQMMGLSGNINNLNQNMSKGDEGEVEQYNQNNMMTGGIIPNNLENNIGVNQMSQGLNNNGAFINGLNMQGYDYNNYNVGLPGQNMNNMNQNNPMIMTGMGLNQ
jgi:hypothetical protein